MGEIENQIAKAETKEVRERAKSENEVSDGNPKAHQLYKKVLDDSSFVPGDDGDLMPVDDISWVDPKLIKIGQDWFHQNVGLYTAATVMAMLTLAVSVKPISALIFCNDKPMEPVAYFRRFVGKLRGIETFFNTLTDPNKFRPAFYKTRKLHVMAVNRLEKVGKGRRLPDIIVKKEEPWMEDFVKAIRKDAETIPMTTADYDVPLQIAENLSWDTQLPFNQFGMVYFAAAFFGAPWCNPTWYGMKDQNDIQMKGLIHVWAVIAKLLGLQDEFNVFINPDNDVIDKIRRQVYVRCLREIDTTVIYLEHMTAIGIGKYIPLLTLKPAMCFALISLGCEKYENTWSTMGIKDKFLFKLIQGVFYLVANVDFVRHIGNWALINVIYALYKNVLEKQVEKFEY